MLYVHHRKDIFHLRDCTSLTEEVMCAREERRQESWHCFLTQRKTNYFAIFNPSFVIILDLKTLIQLFRLMIEFVIFWERLLTLFVSLIHTEKMLLFIFSVTRC